MSENIQSISQGTFTIGASSTNDSSLLVTQNENSVSILQGTVATSAGIVGDGTTQNPLRADETVLWSGTAFSPQGSPNPMRASATMSESIQNFDQIRLDFRGTNYFFNESVFLTHPYDTRVGNCYVNVKKEQNNNNVYIGTMYKWVDDKTLSGMCGYGNTQVVESMTGGYWGYGAVVRVVGINRIANN